MKVDWTQHGSSYGRVLVPFDEPDLQSVQRFGIEGLSGVRMGELLSQLGIASELSLFGTLRLKWAGSALGSSYIIGLRFNPLGALRRDLCLLVPLNIRSVLPTEACQSLAGGVVGIGWLVCCPRSCPIAGPYCNQCNSVRLFYTAVSPSSYLCDPTRGLITRLADPKPRRSRGLKPSAPGTPSLSFREKSRTP